YTGSFDTLIDFIKNGNLVLVKRINNTPLELQDQYSEQDLIKRGYIIFDTIYTNVQDSIFKDVKDFNADNIKYIPFTHPKEVIKMEAGFIDRSNIKMPVFVAKAPKTKYLQDLDPGLIKKDKVIDLQVGSMNEPIRDGNWE
ncbi:MAG: hypothetical protein RQ866_06345, partial [Bacteroidales bacterium]|nr:hypothetical protein [Bacteroidales bacterium]